jgi:hypothetical protein
MIFGQPKSGKSTFASNFEDALFIATESGLKFQTVYGGQHTHSDWNDVKDTVRRICTEDHPFQTIVIDTLDNAFEFCSKHVCKELGISHESDEGYGKGWSAVKKEFKTVIDAIANRGYGVVFISHSKQSEREVRGVKHPYTDNSLTNSAKSYANGLSDFIFYAYIDDDGNRLFRTKGNLNINAGDRSGILPEVIPMDYENLKAELNKQWETK